MNGISTPVRGALLAGAVVACLAAPALATSPNIVISQVYGGGGNSGAPYTHDFVELFNRGVTSVSVTGWSVQYASTTGSTWSRTDLTGTIPAGGYYLVQLAVGAGNGVALPTPDASGSIAMSASAGKVVLRSTTTTITAGTVCPSDASIVDLVGYGSTTNCSEGGSPVGSLTNTTAAKRNSNGCEDTDLNVADFGVGPPQPRNSATAPNDCNAVPAVPRTWGTLKATYR